MLFNISLFGCSMLHLFVKYGLGEAYAMLYFVA